MIIKCEGNRLFVQVPGQERLEILPKSADTFFLKGAEAELTFVKDEQGQVIKAVVRQAGLTVVDAVRLAKEKGL